jgi:hypothetical protein
MRRSLKIGLGAGALIAVGASVAIARSPYGHHAGSATPRLIESIDVARPCGRAFTYLGDSSHARAWSAFVNHITPLNPEVTPDGTKGSIRRSFRNADERGMRWDELFLIVEPNQRRRLRIFNMVGGAAPKESENHLVSEQLYEPLAGGGCRLSFTLEFEQPPSLRDELATRLVGYEVASVFARNIGNVKRLVEQEP